MSNASLHAKIENAHHAIAERAPDATAIEQALVGGDLSKLTPAQRVSYYNHVCESLGLNPATKPFAYITLNGKLTLYALKDCTEQLRSLRGISLSIKAREVVEGCYVVTANARDGRGREDESIGVVPIDGLKGEARANAMMKAETKAKRRVTLSICGLGMLDETEVESIQADSPRGYVVEAASNVALPVSVAPATNGLQPSAPNGAGSGISDNGPDLAVDLPPGSALIERIDVTDTKNPNVKKHLLTMSTGETFSTINTKFAERAVECKRRKMPVYVEGHDTKWGKDLDVLVPVESWE